MLRGVVVISDYNVVGNSLTIKNCGQINPMLLRKSLLYWDRIDFPTNNLIYMESSSDVKYLEEINLLQRSHINVISDGPIKFEEGFVKSQIAAVIKNNQNKNEKWSLAQNEGINLSNYTDCSKINSLEIDLYKSIPVPTAENSIDDILNFKERRKNELMEFRTAMDDFYLDISNSSDYELSKEVAINKIQSKIIDLNKIMNESNIKKILSSVKITFDINSFVTSGIIGGIVGGKIGYPITGGALGLASSFIKLGSAFSLKPKGLPENLKDFSYVFYSLNEL